MTGGEGEVREISDLDRLWREFRESGSKGSRDHLILHYAPLVKYVAGRLGAGLPHTVEQTDLVQGGMLGLMDALEKFDPAREVKFETYAVPRIRGAILDGLRAIDWAPRSVRSRARDVERAQAELEGQLDRAPSDDEVADRLGIGPGELREVLNQVAFASVMALDEATVPGEEGEEGRTLLDTLADAAADPTTAIEDRETLHFLGQSIDRLRDRERLVVRLYYFEGMTLAEIGEILGVTESRVSQIHTKAVASLRGVMTPDGTE